MTQAQPRILVVDDRLTNIELIADIFGDDYEVLFATEGEKALEIAATENPAVILLDVMMPGMDGGELAACFQASPKLKGVPIVFLTAAVTKREVEAGGGGVGGAPFLAKPVVLAEMVACLKHHLGG